MIVVAIIGILAAVAIPAYSDYTARSQVSEAVSLTSAMKTPLAEYYADKGYMPSTISLVGSTTSGKYVQVITLEGSAGATVAVVAQMKASGVNSAIKSKYFAMETKNGGAAWACGGDTPDDIAGAKDTDLEDKFMPAACRP
jgi:type IV pilus assembly protein PilA